MNKRRRKSGKEVVSDHTATIGSDHGGDHGNQNQLSRADSRVVWVVLVGRWSEAMRGMDNVFPRFVDITGISL